MHCKNCRRDVVTYTDVNGKVRCCMCQTILKTAKPKKQKQINFETAQKFEDELNTKPVDIEPVSFEDL